MTSSPTMQYQHDVILSGQARFHRPRLAYAQAPHPTPAKPVEARHSGFRRDCSCGETVATAALSRSRKEGCLRDESGHGEVRLKRPAQRCKMAAPLVLWKEESQSVAILAVGKSGTPSSSRTRRRFSKGTVGYRCSSPRKQQPNERCPDSSDHRLEARCNLKDASTLCYAVLRCVVGTRGLRCRVPVTQKAVRRRARSRVLATQKAVRRPARARVPVTQKAIRRREAACR
ncbi:hypothetical protein Bbelb_313570 [Branchiostoma belcheri]|nr:hypothetical protein Bbelb_313570 [Branchiostoma belcheri]